MPQFPTVSSETREVERVANIVRRSQGRVGRSGR